MSISIVEKIHKYCNDDIQTTTKSKNWKILRAELLQKHRIERIAFELSYLIPIFETSLEQALTDKENSFKIIDISDYLWPLYFQSKDVHDFSGKWSLPNPFYWAIECFNSYGYALAIEMDDHNELNVSWYKGGCLK